MAAVAMDGFRRSRYSTTHTLQHWPPGGGPGDNAKILMFSLNIGNNQGHVYFIAEGRSEFRDISTQ